MAAKADKIERLESVLFWEGEMARVKAGVEPWRHEEATPLLNLDEDKNEAKRAQENRENIAQQNRRIFLSVIGGIFIVAVPDHTLETMYITVVGYSWFVIATMVFK